jgi:tetratricopeptide (TPR) repeat protein
MRAIKTFLFAGVIIGTFSVFATAQDFNTLFDRGLEEFKNKNYTACSATFASAMTYLKPSEPSSPAHFNLGLCKYSLKQYSDAAAQFRRSVEIKPNYVKGMIWLGNALDMSGDPAGALASFEKAKGLEPNNSEIYYHMAITYFGQKKYDLSENNYRRSLELDPNRSVAMLGIARSLDLQDKEDAAYEYYARYQKLDPDNQRANIRIGDYLVRYKKFAEAMTYYNNILSKSPTNADALLGMGNAYYNDGKYEESIPFYSKAAQSSPKWALPLEYLGDAYFHVGRYEDAKTAYLKDLSLNPKNAVSMAQLAKLAVEMSDRAGAVKYYGQLKAVDAKRAADVRSIVNKKFPNAVD